MAATDVTHKFIGGKPRLAGKVGAGGVASTSATTIPHTFVGLTEGDVYIVTANRTDATGTTKNPVSSTETFIGKVSSANFINCVRAVEGAAQAWAADTVLEILFTAAGWNKLIEGLEVEHSQTGTHDATKVAMLAGVQEFTGAKTFGAGLLKATSPQVTTGINDSNGNELVKVTAVASAVNELTISNNATGSAPIISATGEDPNIGMTLTPKGTGTVNIGTAALKFPNADGTSGQFLKTDGSGTLSFGEASSDGWVTSADTWVYASASTFTIAGVDRTSVFTPGTRLKFTQTTAKYAVVASSSFSTDTTVTIAVNTDYTIDNAAITSPYYSYEANPQGYPSWFSFSPTETWTNPPSSRTTTCKFNVVDRKVTMLWGTNGTANAANSSSVITLSIPINHAAVTTTRQPVLGSFMWTDNTTFTDFGAVYSTDVGTITGDCGQTTRTPTIVNISASWRI